MLKFVVQVHVMKLRRLFLPIDILPMTAMHQRSQLILVLCNKMRIARDQIR